MSKAKKTKTIEDNETLFRKFLKFNSHLNNPDSDRSAVLIGAAYLDENLSKLLRAFFVDDAEVVGKFLNDNNGPLGTFSSKIKAAYCLGLITASELNDLDIIRDIRNDFAHEIEISFDSQSVIGRISNLKHFPDFKNWVESKGIPKNEIEKMTFFTSEREHFIKVIGSLALTITTRINFIKTNHKRLPFTWSSIR